MPVKPEISFASRSIEELVMPHQAAVNPLTGSADIGVPIPLTPGRGGGAPALSLQYGSSAGNSVYGVGWSLAGLSAIAISTKDGLPKYDGQDRFAFNGSDELVPTLHRRGMDSEPRVDEQDDYWIHCYRSKVERSHIQFEQWIHKETGRIHWRTRASDNTVSIYGQQSDNQSRIADPKDLTRTYGWLIEAQYDNQGNAIFYEYLPENTANIDRSQSFEYDRLLNSSELAQRYLKRIRYGNTRPLRVDAPIPADNRWLFEVVFDYGDHRDERLPSPNADQPWRTRRDAHSTYRPGFEVRTYRLCRRILMFHNFPELGVTPTLVGATELTHREDTAGTVLEAVCYRAYRHDSAPLGTTQKSLPSLRFDYSAPNIGQSFRPIPQETQENLPQGISGLGYRWIDLYGEGLPGILTETSQAWYYKPNNGNGVFGTQTTVIEKPSLQPGTYTLSDFDQDGNLNLVVLQGQQAGFYEFDRDQVEWRNFQPFVSAPQIDVIGAKVQWIDLNGDGRADILISEQDRFIWYPSEGKEGFGEAIELAKPQVTGMGQAPQLAENPNLDFFFADINGDGLLDLVRVQNGRVEYWPQLGNGRFGDGILMEDAPIIEFDREFDASRIRFVDLDGSGTADLLYIGRGELRYWINACGNRFSEGGRLTALPYLDNLASVQILDLLGDGTPCLVWSCALPGSANFPVQYLQLTNGIKPRLLLSIDNSMGRETHFTYSLSSRHYLRDRQAGREWLSKLPSHMTVVDQIEMIDRISNSRFVSRYEYHDGYFDSEERSFRGFGLVDQYDSEVFAGASAPENYTAPACSRTWYHNGAFGWDTRRFAQFYQGDRRQGLLPRDLVENLADLKADEFEEGIRSLAGMTIRQEVYATDGDGQRADHPYQVTQNAYRLRRLQPSQDDNDACFMAYQSEQLAYNYEQQPADPRITHQFTLNVDDDGNVLEACAIAYPRRSSISDALPIQRQIYITASRQTYLNIDQAHRRELGIPIESQAFEVKGLRPEGANDLFQFESLRAALQPALNSPMRFHQSLPLTAPSAQARLIGLTRNYYWDDEQTGVLPLGRVGQQTLPHHTQSACFTDELLAATLGDRTNPTLLETEGYYIFDAGYWWQRGETYHYLTRDAFYLPHRVERLDAGSTTYTYDEPYYLTLVEVRDALGNRTQAEIDYHLLAPHRITDANDNVAEVRYDPLGVVVVATTQGTILGEDGTAELYGSDRLSAYTPQIDITFDAILAEPARFLQTANQFFYYELDSWMRSGSPLRSLALMREDLVYDGQGDRTPASRIQIGVSYMDGFGRSLQTKQKVEGGLAIRRDATGRVVVADSGIPEQETVAERWLVSGHVVYNNKQQPIRQYEPFFSTTVVFEPDEELRRYGVSAWSFYDPVGRQIRVELPNGSHTRVVMTPWEVRNFDPNDTVGNSRYRVERETLSDSSLEKTALTKALAHADTPTIVRLDPLGREVVQVETSNDGPARTTESRLDIQGNVREIVDARGLTAFAYRYDMLGRVLYQRSLDAGEIWSFQDAMNQPIHRWDGVGVHHQTGFDRLGRPISTAISGTKGDRVTERMVYGDDASITQATLKNARGQLVSHYDQAGVQTVHQYTPDGTPLHSERQLLEEYRTEPDWRALNAVVLDPALRFETRGRFDALGRVREQRLPDGTTRQMDYLLSGGVAQVRVSTADGVLREVPFLQETEMNARGQRVRALLGNGIELTYQYDSEMFRMSRLTARRPAGTTADRTRFYQDIQYTYDPVGNLIHHVDNAQQPALASPYVFQGLNVSSHCDFTYDAFYQLTRATGRVHQALMPQDDRPGLPEPVLKHTQHVTLNNGAVVERYTRTYDYDLGGNIQRINHTADSRSWGREMWISPSSNQSLPATDYNDIPIADPELRFDANGNCTYLPHLRAVDWNYRNNIARVVMIDRSEAGQPSDVEYYVYGGDGMRLRKVQEKVISPGQIEITEKIYLNGAEIKQVRRNGDLILERTTSHISDGTNRIALLHQWTQDRRGNETDDVAQKKIHYQLSNHLGSSSLEVNQAGDIISYEEYFPFGGAAFIAGNNRREVSLKDYRYSGKERDEATGFYYYGYRYYVPWTGRWLSPDPIGPEDGVNLYQFVQNNPVNLTDPNGLQTTRVRVEFPTIDQIPEQGRETARQVEATGRPFLYTLVPNPNSGTDPSATSMATVGDAAVLRAAAASGVLYVYDPSGTVRNSPGLQQEINPESGEVEYFLNIPTAPSSDENPEEESSAIGGGETTAGSGAAVGDGNGSDSSGGGADSGSEEGRSGGSRTGSASGAGTGARRSGGSGVADGVRGGRGVLGGRVGGTGADPVEQRPPNPNGRVDGDPNGSLAGTVGPEEVHAEGAIGGNPNGSEQGTPGGTATTAQPQEELEWWQTALIVVAVIAVAIIATLLTGGAAALILGTSAASWSLGTLVAVGAISGAIAGFTGDLTSQALTLAFRGEENIWDNLDWGQAGQAAFVGAVTGAATAGLGGWLGGASRGAGVAAGAADDVLPTTALYQFASRAVRGAAIGAPTEALGEAARQVVFDSNLDAGRILGAGLSGGAFGSAFEAGLPLVTNRLPTTGTQRLLAAIEANPDQGNLHQRVFAIRERLIERGLLSAEDRGGTTLALTEGFADTPQGLETRTLLHVTDPALYRNIEANRSVLPEGVQLGEINPVRSQGRVVLHAERQGILEMMFLGLDQLGSTATTNLGCSSCQTWMSMFAQQFAHLNPSIAPSGGGRATHAGVRSQFPLGVFFY